ncbi:hypothetical protein N7510_003124 [Penicillium lagena]|uniref:uncharacterized protein n=1 Tax=Penicillium lagena TaxID=94218 RepID=UPI002541CBDF|nr:uncharacterized protein N7510_003124 [Penicillium lagena]KAJ5619140.1 hypothetical protein N7510_003124 [Penicillium lagena]
MTMDEKSVSYLSSLEKQPTVTREPFQRSMPSTILIRADTLENAESLFDPKESLKILQRGIVKLRASP